MTHLASHCRQLCSFEGYFDSTKGLLKGAELLIESCPKLKLMGFLFHPSVRDSEVEKLINGILESTICSRYAPKYKRLIENPNQHVTIRVIEFAFDQSLGQMRKRMICNGNGNGHRNEKEHQAVMNTNKTDSENVYGNGNGAMIYGSLKGENIKSLDEIDFDDEEEEEVKERNNKQLQNRRNHNYADADVTDQIWRDHRCNDGNKNKKGENDSNG